ncbi:hypothetical protein [Nonomuraea sp. NPDC052265]|uniref:hypothetical protein n=1 Tax=Nonomuraea sp. NPDC052265 TaxID=3364374 RepID=UPI0037CA4069
MRQHVRGATSFAEQGGPGGVRYSTVTPTMPCSRAAWIRLSMPKNRVARIIPPPWIS